MAHGHYEGKGVEHPHVRSLFNRERLSSCAWYEARLSTQQTREASAWDRHVAYLENFLSKPQYTEEAKRLGIRDRLDLARQTLERVSSPNYLDHLHGTLGAQPLRSGPE